ncbi:hypothetical protein F5I97DRAFT_1320968 [Phlebopus sp. FC_14]|nr:hypothetical protein F5I97DRAFT_1320968 [Phlebopus sp. FC_14]
MSHLPAEIIFAILEHGYYSLFGSVDHAFLFSCSLVCTSWSAPAQSLLFRSPTELTSRTRPKFYAAILSSVVHGKDLGSVVRSLKTTLVDSPYEDYHPSNLAQLLRVCPKVYELSISVDGLHQFDKVCLAELETVGQGIRALNIRRCRVQSPVVFQLLDIWPSIRFLSIGTEIVAWPWRTLRNSSDTAVRLEARQGARVALYELVLSRTPSLNVLRWILASSSTSLRILDLREFPGAGTREILQLHAPLLRSLRLLHYNTFAAAFLRLCTGLEELVVYQIPLTIVTFGTFSNDIPRSIEHLSFRNPPWAPTHTLRPILEAVDVLPKLRTLTCDRESERLEEFAILQSKCMQKGVEITVSSEPLWVPEDPVVVKRFPRKRSVSNFRLMSN